MTRATRPGSIQAAVAAVYEAMGGIKNAATDAGVSISTLSYGTEVSEERPGGVGANYLDRLGRVERAAAVPLAQHWSHLAGGVFHPVDLSGPAWSDMAAISKEFADVVTLHAAAHSDGSADPSDYTVAEACQQVRELDELVAAALRKRAGLVKRIEAGE
jgi:hypothetical protein